MTIKKRSSGFEARIECSPATNILATPIDCLSFDMGVHDWYFIASIARLEFVEKRTCVCFCLVTFSFWRYLISVLIFFIVFGNKFPSHSVQLQITFSYYSRFRSQKISFSVWPENIIRVFNSPKLTTGLLVGKSKGQELSVSENCGRWSTPILSLSYSESFVCRIIPQCLNVRERFR